MNMTVAMRLSRNCGLGNASLYETRRLAGPFASVDSLATSLACPWRARRDRDPGGLPRDLTDATDPAVTGRSQ